MNKLEKTIKNWNYGKHAMLTGGLYAALGLGGALLLRDKKDNKKKRGILFKVLLACYAIDMTAGYAMVKKMQKDMK